MPLRVLLVTRENYQHNSGQTAYNFQLTALQQMDLLGPATEMVHAQASVYATGGVAPHGVILLSIPTQIHEAVEAFD